jgi:hypothetical protein
VLAGPASLNQHRLTSPTCPGHCPAGEVQGPVMFEGFLKTVTSAAFLGTVGKGVATAAFIIALSEIAKRSTWLAAALVALPLATILTVAMIALDSQKGGVEIATSFALKTFLLFWPGLIFFIGLLGLQKFGVAFWPAFGISVAACFLSTWGFSVLLTSQGWITKD